MNRLKEIIEEKKKIIQETGLRITDDCLFTQACTTYRGELQSQNRGFQKKSFPMETKGSGTKATEKQLNYIYKNNLDVNTENLTKEEAKSIISEHISKFKNNKQ